MPNYLVFIVTVLITCCGNQFNRQVVCSTSGSGTDRTAGLREIGNLPENTKWTEGQNLLVCGEFIRDNFVHLETNSFPAVNISNFNLKQREPQYIKDNKQSLYVNSTDDWVTSNIITRNKISEYYVTKNFSETDDRHTYNEENFLVSGCMACNQIACDNIFSKKKTEILHDELLKATSATYTNDRLTPYNEEDPNNSAVNDSFNNEHLSAVSVISNSSKMCGNSEEDIHKRPCVSDYHNTYKPTLAAENHYQSAFHGIDKDNALNCSGIKHKFTVVSALFNLQREDWHHFQRTFDQYLDYSTQLLNMHIPLVLYVDKSVEMLVRWHRRHKQHITKIIVTSINHFEYYADYDAIKEIMESSEFQEGHAFINHPEGFSPEYNILMNSKLSMLYEVSNTNYFNSSHFFWIDMGYGHGNDIYPNSCDWSPNNLIYKHAIGDKITYIQLNPVDWLSNIHQIYKQNIPPLFNGGFFGGSKMGVQRYYNVHKEMFKLLLSYGMVDDDQTLAVVCYYKEKQLFNLVNGWWYDAFKLFH